MKKFNIAIVGATGVVGSMFLNLLEERGRLDIGEVFLYASAKSAGREIPLRGKKCTVLELCEENIAGKHIDFALFSAGGKVSRDFAEIFVKHGAIVIDNSSAWRMESEVPLVVPQVNAKAILQHKGIIANPNCSTIQCMLPLKALHDKYGLRSVKFVTFQAVSGSGQRGLEDLARTTRGEKPNFYPHPIFNNCLPHIDAFESDGYTREERKMMTETRKILGLPKLKVCVTCVRVPVQNSHSVDIWAEFSRPPKLAEARDILAKFDGITLCDIPEQNLYPLAVMASGTDQVLVGRVRHDPDNRNAVTMFCVADNLRKGAATNAIEIMESLMASAHSSADFPN